MNEKIKKIFESKKFMYLLCAIAGLIVLALVFRAGELTAYRKAAFVEGWSNHYEENFADDHHPLFSDADDQFPNTHGAIGKVIKISLPQIVVLDDNDKTEKSVMIGAGTSIFKKKKTLQPADIKVDDKVVVIGEPTNAGQVDAKFIRILPMPK
jgi:hypothetical protein